MTRIVLRRGTAPEWAAANPVLAAGEPGLETDTGKFKIGDGNTAWLALSGFVKESDRVPGQQGLSVKDQPYGAIGDGVADDTAAIQSAINAVRDSVRAGFAEVNLVTLPTGRYKVTTTLLLPPYVKLRAHGMVIIEWAGGDGTCLWIAPLADDPDAVYGGARKQQEQNCPIIDGINGGLLIRNVGPRGGDAVGLELGSRADLGVARPLSRYKLQNLTVQDFDKAQQMNLFNHFLARFENIQYEPAGTCLLVGNDSGSSVNSGESFTFTDCIFAGANIGVMVSGPAADLNFVNCSFDYLTTAFQVGYGYGRILISGGHIEAINSSNAPGAGIVVTPSVGLPAGGQANVIIQGTVILVKAQTHFKGKNLCVDGACVMKAFSGDRNTAYPEAILAEDSVQMSGLHNLNLRDRRIISRQHNRLSDPLFKAETLGIVDGNLVGWSIGKSPSALLEVVNGGPAVGQKALQMLLPPGTYVELTSLSGFNPRSTLERYGSVALQTDLAGIRGSIWGRYYDARGSLLATSNAIQFYGLGALAPGSTWQMPNYTAVISSGTTAEGAASLVKPVITISNPVENLGTAKVTLGYVYVGE